MNKRGSGKGTNDGREPKKTKKKMFLRDSRTFFEAFLFKEFKTKVRFDYFCRVKDECSCDDTNYYVFFSFSDFASFFILFFVCARSTLYCRKMVDLTRYVYWPCVMSSKPDLFGILEGPCKDHIITFHFPFEIWPKNDVAAS